jgi:hypothetical protein
VVAVRWKRGTATDWHSQYSGGGGGGGQETCSGGAGALAAQASSSFHTQAQHNYLVVALLPNQAVTSFTHSHLLAHLALCHL